MKKTRTFLSILVSLLVPVLCVISFTGCRNEISNFQWKEESGEQILFSGNQKIGYLKPFHSENIQTEDQVTRTDEATFRIKRVYTNTSPASFDSVRLTLDFVHADSASFLMIPAVSYNGNYWGRGKEPKGYKKDREWWTFSYNRTSVPGATYSESKHWAVAMWSEIDSDGTPFSCSLMPEPTETTHRLIWPEEEMPLCYVARDTYNPGFRKKMKMEPGESLTVEATLVVTPLLPHHQATKVFLEKAWKMIPHPEIPVRSTEEIRDLSIKFIHENLWAEEDIFKGFSIGLWQRNGGWIQRPGWKYEIGWAGQNISTANSLLADYLKSGNKKSLERGIACLDTWATYCPLPNGLIRNHFDYVLGIENSEEILDACNLGDAAEDFFIAYELAKQCGYERENYKTLALNICDFMLKDQQSSGQFGKGWDTEGNCLYREGTIGAYIIPPMVRAYRAAGEQKYLHSAEKAFNFYFNDFAGNGFTSAGALDTWCIDKESSWPILHSAMLLFEATNDSAYLTKAEQISWYLSTWLWHYSMPVADTTDFAKYGYDTFAGTAVSTQHHHLDPYGLILVPEWLKLARLTGNSIWKEKALAVWANGNQVVADGKTKIHGVVRPAGSQAEAYFQTYWVGQPGQFNDWLVLWPSAMRLEVLRSIDPDELCQ
jgi:hypothetical protein